MSLHTPPGTWLAGDGVWTVDAIAAFCGVSAPTVRRWIAEYQDCPIVKVGGRHFVLRAAMAEWVVNPSKKRREQS